MRSTSLTHSSIREKLRDLRQAARSLKPEVRGSEEERAAMAMKGFENWSDLRNKANQQVTR